MIFLNFDNTRVKIDLDAILRNFDAVREKAGVPVMAVVKADAYGHGAIQVARLLEGKDAIVCRYSLPSPKPPAQALPYTQNADHLGIDRS